MDVSQLRKEFTVYLIDSSVEQAQSLAQTIKAAGYEDTQVYPTLDSALVMASQNPPHLVLVDFEQNEESTEKFLIDLQTISSEILVVLLIHSRQLLTALQMTARGLVYDSLVRPLTSTLEVLQKLDRGVERLFFQFESEQLREEIHPGTQESGRRGEEDAPPNIRIADAQSPAHSSSSSHGPTLAGAARSSEINDFLKRLSGSNELDTCVQFFMEALSLNFGETPILYFKYVPSHMSLLVSQAVWLPIDKFRGIGVDLKNEDPRRIPHLLKEPKDLEQLSKLLGQVFRSYDSTSFPHVAHVSSRAEGDILGLFVILASVDIDSDPQVRALRSIFKLAYERNLAIKEKHSVDTIDVVSGLFNRRHFSQKIDEEISRSRRILLPVSLITIELDRFSLLSERVGPRQADAVIKMIAAILKKTARVNDILARTGTSEIVALLPHTDHMGAAIKAERIRRIVESTKFPIVESLADGPLTVSCGVSEYPAFSSDSESLLRSADEALAQVKKVGGNKVCLASPPPNFQPDFLPKEQTSALIVSRREETP